MENVNYNILSNGELIEKRNELLRQFEESQQKLKENYLEMVKCSEEAIKIKEIITKRGGKV